MERQRRELQGPRPTPLKLCKDSHKIKKPPIAPRPPVNIIYSVSPKIIHTSPTGFMSLVQRLTGSDSAIENTKIPLEGIEGRNIDKSGFDVSDIRPGGGLIRPVPHTLFSPISEHQVFQQDYLDAFHQHFQYDGLGGDGGGIGGMSSGMILPSPYSATAFLSPNPMLSPASIEFLNRLLEQ